MEKDNKKLFAIILSIALLVPASLIIIRSLDNTSPNYNKVLTTKDYNENNGVTTFNMGGMETTKNMSAEQLESKALSLIPGNILSAEYDYEMGRRIVRFDIADKNGIARELELEVSTGKVYDIDYDYDENGNRFINQSLFEVNKTFEECKAIALKEVPNGEVINHKQDADYGFFIYEFIIKASDGSLYEVDVETQNGKVIKVELNDDYDPNSYNVSQVSINSPSDKNNSPKDVSTNVTEQVTNDVVNNDNVQAPSQPVQNNVQTPSSGNTEADLRRIVLSKYPGTVLSYYSEYDDGVLEHKYTVRQSDGNVYKIDITQNGYIIDVDFEGRYVNGVFYDDDYYDWD